MGTPLGTTGNARCRRWRPSTRRSRWIRLQELARALAVQPEPDLAALAVDLGYTNQAHLTRDFTTAVGTTPGAYARSLRRLAGA